MKNLIERLEKATGPDRELDLAIGEVIGAADHSGPAHHRRFRDWAKHYTASIDAAIGLVPSGWAWDVMDDGAPFANVYPLTQPFPVELDICADARSPAIALCIAALCARHSVTAEMQGP